MRKAVKALRTHCVEFIRFGTHGTLVLANDRPQPCPLCDGPMKVYKTGNTQVCKTLSHGTVVLWETFHICAADPPCRYPSGELALRRSKVSECLIPNRQVGYDVMAFAGTRRYIDYQQRDEILEALEQQGVSISAGTESDLVKLFTGYLRVLHDDPQTLRTLRRELDTDGGYWVHVDATGENGRGTTVAVYAGKRHWVLDVAKISTENADELLTVLRRVVERFGIPLAIMSDMGKAVLSAIRMLLEELGPRGARIIQLICHLHFVRDLGKDLLKAAHSALGKAATDQKIRERLHDVERELTELIGSKAAAREQVTSWLDEASSAPMLKPLPPGLLGLSVLRSLVQWIRDYRVEASDDFPFSQPNLDFFERCAKARELLHSYCQRPPIGRKLQRTLGRLHLLVNAFCNDTTVLELVERIRTRLALWDELRVALRLVPGGGAKSRTHIPDEVPVEQAVVELRDIQSSVETLCDSYRARRPTVSRDGKAAIGVILNHMETYGHLLWGHVIKLPDGRAVAIDRTNNSLENLWGSDKHGERRRSGHKALTHELETKPADALLAHNLTCPDYVQLVCGTLENLPRTFAQMDAVLRQKALAQPKPLDPKDALPRTVWDLIGSMSSAETERAQDRKLIRSEGYAARIESVTQNQQTTSAAKEPETVSAPAVPPTQKVPHEPIPENYHPLPPTTMRAPKAGPNADAAAQLAFQSFERSSPPSPRPLPSRTWHPRLKGLPSPSRQTSFEAFL